MAFTCNTDIVPGLADDGGCFVAEELLRFIHGHVSELDEFALGGDLPASHRLPPNLAGFLPSVFDIVSQIVLYDSRCGWPYTKNKWELIAMTDKEGSTTYE